jgi:hypothetical protein
MKIQKSDSISWQNKKIENKLKLKIIAKILKIILPFYIYIILRRHYDTVVNLNKRYKKNRANKPVLCEKPILKGLSLKKNKYKGERIFIIGGGPSINNIDISLLNNEYTAAVNKGYMLKDRGLHHVTLYGCSDKTAMLDYGKEVPDDFYDYSCIFRNIMPIKMFKNPSYFGVYTKNSPKKAMYNGYFEFNVKKPLAHSYTIVLQMLQVAVWLGFKDIYFVGIDNNFRKLHNMHWYKDTNQEQQNMNNWNFSPEEANAAAFEHAHQILKKKGVNIYNASMGGELETIPKVNFLELNLRKPHEGR